MKHLYTSTLALLMGLTSCTMVQAQMTDIVATGPFPIYISIQPITYSGSRDDLASELSLVNGRFGTKWQPRKHSFGLALNGGFKFGRFYFAEYGFSWNKHCQREGGNRFQYTSYTHSLRIGFRNTLRYPFSTQLFTGPFIGNTTRRTDANLGKADHTFQRAAIWQIGMDHRARFTFLDPVGAGGGLGFFLEFRVLQFIEETSPLFSGFYKKTGSKLNVFLRDDFQYMLSFGFIAPLALRK